jgi:hypothetical protein
MRRRVVLRDYGKNIYKVNSRIAILITLKGHITGKKCKQRMAVFKTNKNKT